MQTLYAVDLTELPGASPLWRPGRAASEPGDEAGRLHAPRDGFASPLGFWFAPAGSWSSGVAPLCVEVVEIDELERGDEARVPDRAEATGRRRARVDRGGGLARREEGGTSKSGPLILEIDERTARIGVDAAAWPGVSVAVLVVVAQFWRFFAIERTLGELNDWARVDLEVAQGPFNVMVRRRRSRQLRERHHRLQALLLDLPLFEGPLTDPRGYLPPGRPVRLYRALAARLGLGRRRLLIDERVEVIEAVLDSLLDSLNHIQALGLQVVLELIIVAVLLLDIGLYFLGSD